MSKTNYTVAGAGLILGSDFSKLGDALAFAQVESRDIGVGLSVMKSTGTRSKTVARVQRGVVNFLGA